MVPPAGGPGTGGVHCLRPQEETVMRVAKLILAFWLVAWIGAATGQPELAGTASVSGTVRSPAPFKAAKVYFRNTDRRMQYMVYTADGLYNAKYLLPGNYEMRVEAKGLESPVRKVTLKAGVNPAQDATLRAKVDDAQIVTLDEMFPP